MTDKQIATYCDDVKQMALKQFYKIQNQRKEISILHKKCVRKQAELEELRIENQSLRAAANSYKIHYNEAGTEAIKEFAKKLKNSIYINTNLLVYQCEDVESVIDDIVKEMVGDTE